MKPFFLACCPRPLIAATLVLACVLSGCHSKRSKSESPPPVAETPARPSVSAEAYPTPPATTLGSPVAQTPSSSASVAPTPPSSASAAFDPSAPARSAGAPLEQTIRIKVNVEEPKPISQPVALDVKFAKQPQLEVPVSLNVKMPTEAERRIPVVFSVDSSTPLIVPIRFQAEPGSQVQVDRPAGSGGGFASDSSRGANPRIGQSDQFVAGTANFDSDRIPIRLLVILITAAGMVGGVLRSFEARRVMKRQAEKPVARDGSKLSFDERVRAIAQQYEASPGEQSLMFFANVLWGVLAAALVPACLVVARSPLLIQINESRAHVLALFGFCLIAATVGAELIVLVLRSLHRRTDNSDHAQPHQSLGVSASGGEDPGRPASAASE